MGGNGKRSSVLLVANEELAGGAVDAVAREIRRVAVGQPDIHVVAPALASSALKHRANDIDDAVGTARERLETSLRALHEAGLPASGEIGDADPLRAVQDELLKYDVDRIFLITHDRGEESAFGERKLLERVESEVEPPATELRVAGHQREEEVVGRRTAHAGADHGDDGRRVSWNLPPLRSLDTAGLIVAVIGTIVLFVLAGNCPDQHGGGDASITGACAVRFLLAGGFFLVNLAHAVALLLMSSVSYRGPFERYVAQASLFGTPLAIVVSLLIA
jgi:hypothetical protein